MILILMIVTAYCPCEKCCGKFADGITSSGARVTANGGKFLAADKRYKFGTVMDVPGYGKVPVLDRGGKIKGNKIDVFFKSHKKAVKWGRQRKWVKVYLKKGSR